MVCFILNGFDIIACMQAYVSELVKDVFYNWFSCQVCQTVRAPICYSDDIIGAQGANINYIRWRSGAILIVEESLNPGEMILVIKGTFSQVEIAYQLIQVRTHILPFIYTFFFVKQYR